MNIELAMTVLSLLGDVPMPHQGPVAPDKLTATYAEWVDTATVTINCPDPESPIDAMGQPAVVSRTLPSKEGGTMTVSMPVLMIPKSMTCDRFVHLPNHTIFPSMMDAGEFRLQCPIGQCLDWHTRPATDDEVVDYALMKRGWKIDHYPGGDPTKYPQGIFEVYPQDERSFDHPLGQGSTAIGAVAVALQGGD